MRMFRLFVPILAATLTASAAMAGGPVKKPVRTPHYFFVPIPGAQSSVSAMSQNGRFLIGSVPTDLGSESRVWKDGRLERSFERDTYLTAVNNRGAVCGSLNRQPFVEYNREKGGTVSANEGEMKVITNNGTAYGYITDEAGSAAYRFDPYRGGSYPLGRTPGIGTNYIAANDRGSTVYSTFQNYAIHVYLNGYFGTYEVGFGYGTVRVSTLTGDNAVLGAAYDGRRMNPFIQYPGAPIQTLQSLEIDTHSWATPRSISGMTIVGVDDGNPDQMPFGGYDATAIVWFGSTSKPLALDKLVVNGRGLHFTDAVGIAANGVIAVNATTKSGRQIGGRLIPFYSFFPW